MSSEYNNTEVRITTALLLAAGTGSRLMPLTEDAPKCLTMINEISMLERLVESLKQQGFKRLVVVTGHLKRSIEVFLGSRSGDMVIEYVHSPLYKTTNNIYSLWMARKIIDEPFVLFESDLIFDTSLLDEMIYPDRIAVAGIADWMNGTTVITNSNHTVLKFKTNTVSTFDEVTFKTVNIYSFSLLSWRNILKRLETHIAQGRVNGYYETVFAELVDEGTLTLKAISFDSQPWYEVDTILDLEEAIKLFPSQDAKEAIAKPQRYEIVNKKSDDNAEGFGKQYTEPQFPNSTQLPKALGMVGFIKDLPNICSLTGLLSAILGIYFALLGHVYIAIVGLLWAVLFDWLDGLIASKMTGRTDAHRAFGGQLDSLIDMVSFGVLPAKILLSYSDYNPWFVPGAFVIVASCAIRLSYFNIYGLTGGKTYTGLAVDYNGLIISFAFLFETFFNQTPFSIGLYALVILIASLNLASIQIPKFSKKWIYCIAAYVIGLSIYYGIKHYLSN